MPIPAARSASVARGITSLLAVASLLSCEYPTAPAFPDDAVPFAPPERYALWWGMTEACSGRTGDLASVRWYVVPGVRTIVVNGKEYSGYWYGRPDRIVLAGESRFDGALVRHEMLHVLLGPVGHPRVPYLTSCNDIVACVGECETDAGGRPTPAADAPVLDPRDVGTRVDLVPAAPAESIDSGAIAVIVSITNPRAEPVWVRLTPQAPGDRVSHTFGYTFDYDDPAQIGLRAYAFTKETRFPLGANETRRWVYDGDIWAGRYGVRGWFNTDTTARFVIDVGR